MKSNFKINSNKQDVQVFSDRIRRVTKPILIPLAKGLAKLNIHPNLISIIGFFGFVVASVFVGKGYFFLGALILLIFAPLDAIDGTLARLTNKVSPFGAFLDSTLDRYAEIFLFAGFLYFYLSQGNKWGVILSFLGITGSLMVSYTRARAEGTGFECKVGFLTRFERLFLIILALFLNLVFPVLVIISFFTHLTALQRILHVYKSSKN